MIRARYDYNGRTGTLDGRTGTLEVFDDRSVWLEYDDDALPRGRAFRDIDEAFDKGLALSCSRDDWTNAPEAIALALMDAVQSERTA